MSPEAEQAMAPKISKDMAPKVKGVKGVKVPTKLEREADLVMGVSE